MPDKNSWSKRWTASLAVIGAAVAVASCSSVATGPIKAGAPTSMSVVATVSSGLNQPSDVGETRSTAEPATVGSASPTGVASRTSGASPTGDPAGQVASAQGSSRNEPTGAARSTLTSAPIHPTTPVAAPGHGNVNQTVPTGTPVTKPAVPLTSTAAYGNGVTVTLSAVKKVTTVSELPGEIAGPGVQMAVTFHNGSSAPTDLNSVVVDLQDASGVSAGAMSASPAKPVAGSLAPGATASGVYVYTLGKNFTGPARLSVSYSAQAPVVLFSGPIS